MCKNKNFYAKLTHSKTQRSYLVAFVCHKIHNDHNTNKITPWLAIQPRRLKCVYWGGFGCPVSFSSIAVINCIFKSALCLGGILYLHVIFSHMYLQSFAQWYKFLLRCQESLNRKPNIDDMKLSFNDLYCVLIISTSAFLIKQHLEET